MPSLADASASKKNVIRGVPVRVIQRCCGCGPVRPSLCRDSEGFLLNDFGVVAARAGVFCQLCCFVVELHSSSAPGTLCHCNCYFNTGIINHYGFATDELPRAAAGSASKSPDRSVSRCHTIGRFPDDACVVAVRTDVLSELCRLVVVAHPGTASGAFGHMETTPHVVLIIRGDDRCERPASSPAMTGV